MESPAQQAQNPHLLPALSAVLMNGTQAAEAVDVERMAS